MHMAACRFRGLVGVFVIAVSGARGRPGEASFTIRTDGSETSETGPQGMATASTLRRDGAALVLAMRIKGTGFEATNDVGYERLEGGRRLRAAEQGRSPLGNHDAVWIYDRR